MRTRVKICGITRAEDALTAARLGADAIGLVFYPPSPRAVTAAQAAEVVRDLPPFVSRVGLFVNATREAIAEAIAAAQLDLLQFHGEESPAACQGHGRPWIKALRMAPEMDVAAEMARYREAQGILLDAWRPGVPGGTGETFDWSRIPAERPRPLILAGGLAPENVAEAIRRVRPWAVDVSGGVERTRGIKDAGRMASFIREVMNIEH